VKAEKGKMSKNFKRSARGLAPFGQVMGGALKDSFASRGGQDAGLFVSWTRIVGPEIAKMCVPEKLTCDSSQAQNTTLILRVAPGAALYVESYKAQILAHVHRFYGYPKIAHLRLFQAPLPKHKQVTPREVRQGEVPEGEEAHIQNVGDEGLQEALRALARTLYAPEPK